VTTLLDGSVLIALTFSEHVHFGRARTWFATVDDSFATCPVTQGSLVRFLLRQGLNSAAAKAVLATVTGLPNHVFWADSIAYMDVRMDGVIGHGQVTDAYLAQLARTHGGRLATFDEGLALLHRDTSDLIN